MECSINQFFGCKQCEYCLNQITKMESYLTDIIRELEQLLQNSKILEEKYLGQVLALQKIINNPQKTIPQVVKKQMTVNKQKEEKKQTIKISVQSQVNAFLNEIQIKQKFIESEQKPKLQIKTPEVVIQKKPPLPTVNRIQKNSKNVSPTYIPPRNKNQVTGKVTQNTIRTSNHKTFKPQLANTIRSSSRQAIKVKDSVAKTKNQLQIKQQKKQTVEEAKKIDKTSQLKPAKIQEKIFNSQINSKKEEVTKQKINQKCHTFSKDLEQLFEQFSSKGTKNRKTILQKMIKQCQNQQMGHKKNEQQSRFSCIRQINNYAQSRNRVTHQKTHTLQRNRWSYNPQLFQLQIFLADLQNEFSGIQNLKQFRLDPKQQYRLFKSFREMQKMISEAEEKTTVVPDQLQLSFHHNTVQRQLLQTEDELSLLNDVGINQKFSSLLDFIQQSGSLQKNQLRCLQVLAEIGIFKSKKSPILAMSQEFDSWKNYYFQNL